MPWALPTTEAELLVLAKAYPFEAPGGSYRLSAGSVEALVGAALPAGCFEGRVPVIAYGSNRAPAQLLRKFGAAAEIPVSRAWLRDYDVVYSAHVTRYGSIAANLRHAPGARVEVFVTWLTAAQLVRMHETEFGGENYLYGSLRGIDLILEAGPSARLAEACVYVSRRGCLAHRGGPLGLAAIPAEGRAHGALDQPGVLELVRARHRAELTLDAHILETIRDAGRRSALIAALMAEAVPAAAPHFQRED